MINEVIKTEDEKVTKNPSDVFNTLYYLDVSDHIEKKSNGKTELSYLSWAWAWAEVKKRYPDVQFEVKKNENGMPFFEDPDIGLMVYVSVTIKGITHEIWLPVMDGANNAMKRVPYSIKTKFGEKQVAAATAMDVNKACIRALTKALGLHGIGLCLYQGEDLPEESEEARAAKEAAEKEIADTIKEIDKAIRIKSKDMDTTQKREFANNVIVPIIGVANYKSCRDIGSLKKLLETVAA